MNGIFSTRARILAAGFAGLVATAAAIFGILETVGVFDDASPHTSVVNNINNSTVNQYYGTLAGSPDSGPSEPPANSYCGAPLEMGKIGQGYVFVTLTEKLSLSTCWSQYLAPVIPGSIVRFLISYRNLTHLIQRNVVVRVNLPAGFQLVPNSTRIYDPDSGSKGIEDTSNNLAGGGIIIGNYASGAWAYITFSLAVPFDSKMSCGWNDFHPVGIIQPERMAQFYNIADLEVARQC